MMDRHHLVEHCNTLMADMRAQVAVHDAAISGVREVYGEQFLKATAAGQALLYEAAMREIFLHFLEAWTPLNLQWFDAIQEGRRIIEDPSSVSEGHGQDVMRRIVGLADGIEPLRGLYEKQLHEAYRNAFGIDPPDGYIGARLLRLT